ncbi:TVP38/TMEM64 family protein [Falsihalocynthiibacter sp. S25ZX9]|uniref:TVP38/TMEM64 family protein n=1 Tax=Falsihalocynthiibacter sp. S25ZX9 TaxID=3240870 RepID=UPI00350F38DE
MVDNSVPVTHRFLRLIPLVVILIVAVLGAFLLREQLSFEALRANHEALVVFRDNNFILTMLGFITIYTLIVTFSLPGAGMSSITGGFLFSLFPGVLLNMTAATIGATLIFLAARWGIGATLAEKMENSSGAVKKIKDGIDENQWSVLFAVRLVPILPFFLVNLVLSSVGVPLYRFIISTFLGIIPGALVYTSIGAGVGEVLAQGGTPDFGVIFEAHILLPILGLAALALLPIVLKIFKKDLVE